LAHSDAVPGVTQVQSGFNLIFLLPGSRNQDTRRGRAIGLGSGRTYRVVWPRL